MIYWRTIFHMQSFHRYNHAHCFIIHLYNLHFYNKPKLGQLLIAPPLQIAVWCCVKLWDKHSNVNIFLPLVSPDVTTSNKFASG